MKLVTASIVCAAVGVSTSSAIAGDKLYREVAAVCTSPQSTIDGYKVALGETGWIPTASTDLPQEAQNALALMDTLNELSQPLGDEIHIGVFAKNLTRLEGQLEDPFDFVHFFTRPDRSQEQVLRLMVESSGRVLCWANGSLSDASDWIDSLSSNEHLYPTFVEPMSPEEMVSDHSLRDPALTAPTDQIKLRSVSLMRLNTASINSLLGIQMDNDLVLHTSFFPK